MFPWWSITINHDKSITINQLSSFYLPDLLTLWLAIQLRASLFTFVCWNLIIAHYFVGNNLKDRKNRKISEKFAYTFFNRPNLLFCGWSQKFSGPRFIQRYIRNRALSRSVIARVGVLPCMHCRSYLHTDTWIDYKSLRQQWVFKLLDFVYFDR